MCTGQSWGKLYWNFVKMCPGNLLEICLVGFVGTLSVIVYYTPDRREGGNKRCFCPSVCLSVAYIANNSRTQRTSVLKFERKFPHLRCDSHTSLNVKRSKASVRGGRGHTVSVEPAGYTACFCRAMLCKRRLSRHVVSVSPSVCLCVRHVRGSCQNE